jgi:tetratricopeptide (TPR) repeat protein
MIDRKIEAEVHFNSFEAAIGEQDWTGALEALQQALALDPSRCPFPAEEYELTQVLSASNLEVELLCRHRASNVHLIFKAPRTPDEGPADFADADDSDAEGVLASEELGDYPLTDEGDLTDEPASEELESYSEAEDDPPAEEDAAYDDEPQEDEYDPEQAAFLCARGRDHRANGDLEAAFADFTDAIYLDPESADAYNSRANLYFAARQFDEAIADYSETIRINPDLAVGYLNRGLAQARKQQSAEAIADATEALRFDPTLAAAYYLRGTNQEDPAQAVADLTQAIRLYSADPAVYDQRGLAHAKLGDYDRAIEDYDQALRLAPELGVAHYHRACAYQLKGDPIRAIAEYSEVVQLDPKNADAYFQRGLAYASQGDHDSAIGDFTECYRLNPNNALAIFKRDEAVRAKKQSARSSRASGLAPPASLEKTATIASPKVDKDKAKGSNRSARLRWAAIGGISACLLLGAGSWIWVGRQTAPAKRTAHKVAVEPAVAVGHHGQTDCQFVRGWAWDPNHPDTAVHIDVYDGDTFLGTVLADNFRQDLLGAGIGTGKYGFAFSIPASMKDNKPHSIRCRLHRTNADLTDTPQVITCGPES